jgi:hypothetical protein
MKKRFFIFFVIFFAGRTLFFVSAGLIAGVTYGGLIFSAFTPKKGLIEFVGADEYEYYRFAIDEKNYAEIIKIPKNSAAGEKDCFETLKTENISIENIVESLRIRVVKRESFFHIETVYGYASKLSGLYNMNGKFINIQIVDNGDYILIGSPYIPDGF